MIFKKEYRNIYLVTAIMVAAFAFMILSTWNIFGKVSGETSVDIAIDKAVDQCWEEQKLDEKK